MLLLVVQTCQHWIGSYTRKTKTFFLLILCLVLQSKNDKAEYSVNKSGT